MRQRWLFSLIALAAVSFLSYYLYGQPVRTYLWTTRPTLSDSLSRPNDRAEGREGSRSDPVWRVVARDLNVPWEVGFLPNGDMIVTERGGRVTRITSDGERILIHQFEDLFTVGEGGLLGLALHPKFEKNRFLYLYRTVAFGGAGTTNAVVRFVLRDNALHHPTSIINGIPGARYHDGGRLAFGPDGMLYITTGDARQPHLAQDTTSLAGKILRLKDDGTVPEDNPFGNAVYSYGHRNPQGLAWDDGGTLYSTEHGRSGVLSGLDEFNRIQSGSNYGWPDSQGDIVYEGTVAPLIHSGAKTTWAPGGLTYRDGSFFFGGLRGQQLYRTNLSGAELQSHFQNVFGRIRTTHIGPDGALYLLTSNRDGRGNAQEGDDKIIRVEIRYQY